MSLGQSLFNALKGRLIVSAFLWLVIEYLRELTDEALTNYEENGMHHPFKTLESAVFTSDVVNSLKEIRDESTPEQEFLEFENVHGVHNFCTWANLVDLLVERLRHKGYSNVDRAFDDIVLAMMFLAFRDVLASTASAIGTLANLLQLAFEVLSSNPEEEAGAAGQGSGEPQPEAEAQGQGSGAPQPEEEAINVPMDAERVHRVRRYRLRDTPQRELSRQRRARSRYWLRDTPARRERSSGANAAN